LQPQTGFQGNVNLSVAPGLECGTTAKCLKKQTLFRELLKKASLELPPIESAFVRNRRIVAGTAREIA
jgi:hypothetical protein